MLSTEIEKLAKLIVENDLLFKIVENWGTVPIYVNDRIYTRQRTIAIGNNLEDYQTLTSHLKRCLSVYYDDNCTANLDSITRLLDRYGDVIKQVIDDPDPDRYIYIVIVGEKREAKQRIKIRNLFGWFMVLNNTPTKDIRIEEIDNK